jgi:lysophospholipase L1-like esterase
MSVPRWAVSLAITLLLAARASAAGSTLTACAAPEELTRFKIKLRNTGGAIRTHRPLVIVAIGSSSTEGIGASDAAHSYPALLAEELRHRWPENRVTVINKGARGEIASQMLARFERDVLAHHPQLVIWQTGSNHVLRSDSIEDYTSTIRHGIGRLQAASADVVLMDPQFAPRLLGRPKHLMVLDSIRAVADRMKAAVFRRFEVMQHWISSGRYKFEDIISADGLHMNDLSYGCIARLLGDSVAAAAEFRPAGTDGISRAPNR